MLGYQLFDMLLWCNGWKDNLPLRPEIFRSAPGFYLSEKLSTIMNSLEDWTQILPAAQKLADEASQQDSSKSLVQIQKKSNSGLLWAISNLLQVSKEKGHASWHKILMNIYAMAFVIRWFSPVRYK